jgi:uncharacterized protein (DUF2267 family)
MPDADGDVFRENTVMTHTFDHHVDVAKRWLAELADQLDLATGDSPRALRAMRAGLHAIRDRLPPHEVLDLAAQLPVLIRGFYLEGWSLRTSVHQIRDPAALIAHVQHELQDRHLDPVDVLRAVIHLLVEHVTAGEIEDVLATLPASLRELWHDLTGHALIDATVPQPARG